VNPIAGMGGSVGLKGTDNDAYLEALKLGAKPVAPERIRTFLSLLKNRDDILFLVAPRKMGANLVKEKGLNFKIMGETGNKTTAEDTKQIARAMLKEKAELVIFCGGDGTARDIFDAIGLEKPVIAIPSGVKMYSSIFTLNPKAAAEMLDAFLKGTDTIEGEILDINEDSFKKGILDSRLYGYLKVPKVQKFLQGGKQGSTSGKTAEENKNEIAEQIVENMKENVLYLLGPGTTVKAISNKLNLPKTLLGIDAIFNKNLIETDLNEKGILNLLKKYKNEEIIVSPIGGQGFVFGRGNKQFTPKILKKIGKQNIRIVATEAKMRDLTCLRVDTGDGDVDNMLKGFAKVITGYKEEIIMEIEC
jgi:predicted polyphosphate/ATP-dependent NAD kinase